MINLKHPTRPQIIIIAIVLAVIGVLIYTLSGRANFDQNKHALQDSQQIGDVTLNTDATGQTTATVNCDDGSSYDIYYPPGETDYSSVASNKCHQK